MANVKISALTTLSSVSDTTVLPVVDSGTTKKTTALSLKTYIGAGSNYSNTNVAAYLTANPPASSYGNTQVIANLQNLTTNITTTANISAGIISSTNNGNGTNFKVGDDVWIGDVNVANTMRVAGQQDGTQGYIVFGNVDNNQYIGRSGSGPITVTGNLTVTGGTTNAGLFQAKQVTEAFINVTPAGNAFALDCSAGQIFNITMTNITAGFTANLTNLNLASGYVTTVSLILNQGSTPYVPATLQIGGTGTSFTWQGSSTPAGVANKRDVVAFNILNNSGTYIVYTQLVSF